MNHKIFSVDNS